MHITGISYGLSHNVNEPYCILAQQGFSLCALDNLATYEYMHYGMYRTVH